MAINADAQWWIRVSGSNNNGAGYDSTISGAGTNYADQDTAQLALTDLATSGAGSTTLTSVTGGFTSAMIGNAIKIRSGTNFQTGYYFVTGHTDTNTVTVDRTPTSGGAGSSGAGNLGGASANIGNYASGGSLGAPAVTSPLAAGHQVNIRGAGTNDPSAVDYDHSGGNWNFNTVSGNSTSGNIKWVGYNGRPHLMGADTLWYLGGGGNHWFENLKLKLYSTSGTGLISSGNSMIYNCIFEQNGVDGILAHGSDIINCWFKNTGSTSSGTALAIGGGNTYVNIINCVFDSIRGGAVKAGNYTWHVIGNIFSNCNSSTKYAIEFDGSGGSGAEGNIFANNTFYNNASGGIKCSSANSIMRVSIFNNIFANNGGYGINISVGTTALNDRRKGFIDYNCFYSNTSGAVNGFTGGSHDSTSDPQFTNAASGDFSIGTNLKAAAFPGAFLNALVTGYLDMGAVQRQESSSSTTAINISNHVIVAPFKVVGY